jgi:methylenetetrahydrofolate/methylenetetrahydromethanopterin dehydrogenase (NADP+)
MTKKLLFHFDTDPAPSVFDAVVAYDGGADHVQGYAGMNPENALPLVDGTIFTRGPSEKKFTAIFIGGTDMTAGEKLLEAVKSRFFLNFRVSVMLDSNGSNTTAAAGVALAAKAVPLAGKRAVVLAGTGPVGRRTAVFLAKEGAEVTLTSRFTENAAAAVRDIEARFGVKVEGRVAFDNEARAKALEGAQIVFGAGKTAVNLLEPGQWQDNPTIELIGDYNAMPPLGIQGVKSGEKGGIVSGKIAFGALGIGGLKMKLHRSCIGQLFERDDQIFDAEEIYALAKTMA